LSWDDLLTLSTLARHQTYQHTARELGLTRSTVVRRIQRLELALGFQVVEEHHDEAGAEYPESAALRQRYPELKAQFRSNNLAAQIQAVRNGGIGLLPEYVERHYSGLAPLQDKIALEKTMYIVFHSMHRDHPKIRAVADWLKDSLA
jgi:DNA-binding transcriptional LysR family regulator